MSQAQIAIAIAGLALTLVLFFVKSIRSNEHRLSVLETKIGVFWKIIEEGAAQLLHRDDTPEIDALLDRVRDKKPLSSEERDTLVRYLRQIETDKQRTKGEQTMALIYRAMIVAKYNG